ncbi:hypothetical protein [Pseudorhodoplanes sinuspersici]|uniref:Uncharacterized protein n=1 Tax=Pseudorhodoplanes sinuspersici TaxID=1235591 RepID=A0A1W6ZWY6_9HYPH|nr:hypothetical protein [Pseudorhodoplanes sinuspersici]ARQ01830.1 hypothetical protein CAK95_24075 [Pseudorhodoplanes sinuspersici]RKE73587.1 hypothetical protein DFP91_1478 [Pseudorhodoplanes sinuspersici]
MIGNQTSTVSVAQSQGDSETQDQLQVSTASLTRLLSAMGLPEVAVFCGGLLLTISCTGLAIAQGAGVPMALMAGYCSLAATIALVIAFHVLKNPPARVAPTVAAVSQQPNYSAWKLVSQMNIANASRLWCDIEPGHPYSRDSMAWATAMLDAIKTGALPIAAKPNMSKELIDRERANPTWHTEITREALQSWAKAHGHNPEFLRQ